MNGYMWGLSIWAHSGHGSLFSEVQRYGLFSLEVQDYAFESNFPHRRRLFNALELGVPKWGCYQKLQMISSATVGSVVNAKVIRAGGA